MRTRAAGAAVLALTFALSGCWGDDSAPAAESPAAEPAMTVAQLRDLFASVGIACPGYRQMDPLAGARSTEHAICGEGPTNYGLDVYATTEDRDATRRYYDGFASGCTVYGEDWTAWWADDIGSNGWTQQYLIRRLDAQGSCAS